MYDIVAVVADAQGVSRKLSKTVDFDEIREAIDVVLDLIEQRRMQLHVLTIMEKANGPADAY